MNNKFKILQEILAEADRQPFKKQTQKTTFKDPLTNDMFRRRSMGDIEPVSPEPQAEPKQQTPPKQRKVLSGDETRRRTANITPNQELAQKLGAIDPNLEDKISDEQARRNAGLDNTGYSGEHRRQETTPNVPVKPNTIPKIINRDLQMAGNEIVPNWNMVKNLPGYLASSIRAIGRAVFNPFTRTELEEIQVIANLMGQGPNNDSELGAVLNHLAINATRDREAEIVFHDKIPDYGADIKIFKDKGITYMTVKDFGGKYIYAWPSDDEHKAIDNPNNATIASKRRLSFKESIDNTYIAEMIDLVIRENFKDGKNPGRKGLSRRVGIPKQATLAQLEKITQTSTGERRRMAQWQLNMRRGQVEK